MYICVYGTAEDKKMLAESLSYLAEYSFRRVTFDYYDQYDTYIGALNNKCYDAVFVTADNAEGMEGVIATKSVCSDKPVVWFSNDKGFGVQSYRLGCAYFAEKIFTPEKVAAALSRCRPIED